MTRRIIQISFLFLLLNLAGGVKSLAMPANGLTYTQDVLPVRCTGTNSGAIADTVRGGVPPYGLYCTKDGLNFFTGTVYDSIAQIIGLDTGTYQVTIYDADHDTVTGTAVVTGPTLITAALHLTSDTICGQRDTLSCAISGGSPPYSISWTTNGVNYIFGDTLTMLMPDTFTAVVSDSNGCVFICDTIVYGCLAAVNQISSPVSALLIYPDPVTDFAKVNMDDVQVGEISIYTLAGSLIKQCEQPLNNSFYTGNLAAGVYLVEVSVGGERRSLRFVKE